MHPNASGRHSIAFTHRVRLNRELPSALAAIAILVGPSPAYTGEVILWNKLGSVQEIQNSETGPPGTIVGGSYAFEPAQFGRGYVRKATGENYVMFPSSLINQVTHRGAVALWVNSKVPAPEAYSYGVFGLIGTPYYGPPSNLHLQWGDGATGQGINVSFGLTGSEHASTPPEPAQFYATPYRPFHVAVCWDIEGIDGTSDRVRVYRDGAVVGRTSDRWDLAGTYRYELKLGYSPDAGGYDKYIVDNIVMWNYAKTDFSDRGSEMPVMAPSVSDPASQASCVGQTVAFAVTASGTAPFSYQWYHQGAALSGATAAVLTLANLRSDQSGTYWVVVTDAREASATSKPATLVVGDACLNLQLYAGMEIHGEQGLTYEIRYATDLKNPDLATWTPLASQIMGADPWFFLDRQSPTSPQRFYAVRLQR